MNTKQRLAKNEYMKVYNKAYRKANPDKRRAYRKAHLNEIKAYRKAYYKAHINEAKAYYKNNSDKYKAYCKAHRKANPDKYRSYCATRRALKLKATPLWANQNKIDKIYRKAHLLTLITGREYHVDHIIPLNSKLVCGLHVHYNMQILSKKANQSKSNKFKQLPFYSSLITV